MTFKQGLPAKRQFATNENGGTNLDTCRGFRCSCSDVQDRFVRFDLAVVVWVLLLYARFCQQQGIPKDVGSHLGTVKI